MAKIDKSILLGLPSDLLKSVDKEAKRMGVNRTEFLRHLIHRHFKNREREEFIEALRKDSKKES
jgi:hypothetical protein